MKIRIHKRNTVLTEKLRAHVLRKLGFALSRFGAKIVSVVVRFSNVNRRQGGSEKRCQIEVGLRRSVTTAGTDGDVLIAVDRAAERAGRSVARALERERETEANPPGPPSKRK